VATGFCPTTNGFPRVQKPPLVYGTMLVSTSLFRRQRIRAASAQCAGDGRGWIVATYLIMRRLGGERFGLASALVFGPRCWGVWVFNQLWCSRKPFLACFISLGIWCLVEGANYGRSPRTQERNFPPGSGVFSRRLLVSPLLDFSGAGRIEQGSSWGALAIGHGGSGGTSGSELGVRWLRPVLSLRGSLVFLSARRSVVRLYGGGVFPDFLSAHFLNEQLGRESEYAVPRRCQAASARAILRAASSLLDACHSAAARCRLCGR